MFNTEFKESLDKVTEPWGPLYQRELKSGCWPTPYSEGSYFSTSLSPHLYVKASGHYSILLNSDKWTMAVCKLINGNLTKMESEGSEEKLSCPTAHQL